MNIKTQQISLQIFTIWSDEIKGRIDPGFYRPEFIQVEQNLKKLKYKKLKDIVKDIKNGSTPTGGIFEDSGVPYFRSQDFRLFDFEVNQYIKQEFHEKLNRSAIKPGDVLLAVVGATLGVVGCVPDEIQEGNINQNVARLRVKGKEIDAKYLAIVLDSKYGQRQIHRLATATTQAYLNNEQLGEIKILLPPLKIQNQIVAIMQKAYEEKKEKETEAGKLLGSIDEYVLGELGIKMPAFKTEMVFEVWSDKMKNRIDAEYYQNFYKKFIEEILKCKFKKEPLENITEFIMNGLTPAKEKYTEDKENSIPIIKAGTASGKAVNLEKLGYAKKGFRGKKTVKKGDIFILSAAHQAEYVGKNVSMLDQNPKQDTYFVGELVGVRADNKKCLSEYLFSFLSSKFIFILTNREKRGQTAHLYPEDLKKLLIPFPSFSIQNKIAKEVKLRMQKAERLKNEAKEVLEKAKEKVEAMIFGVIN